jgi:tRNA-dihydrouridine synthase
MKNNFWKTLPKPFTALAPMEGVTDIVFRQIMLKISRPDVFFTEFTSASGLMSKGYAKVARALKFKNNELPIVAQIWGKNPEEFYKTSKICADLGFSGIDINMGCPIATVVKKGACAALIKNPNLAKELIAATKEGSKLPVSVKTRIGFENEAINDWIGFLLEQNLAALTVHLRTAMEMSKFSAHWEYAPKIVSLRNALSPSTVLIGNGDLKSYSEILEKYKQYGIEGFMAGRGVFSNPWIFKKQPLESDDNSSKRLELYLKHIKLFEKIWQDDKNPDSLKKFSKMYINNFAGATEFRDKINSTKNTSEIIKLISGSRQKISGR